MKFPLCSSSEAIAAFAAESLPRTIRIAGTSMAPLFRHGEEVSIAAADHHRLKAGHCYVFVDGGKLIMHRFVAWEKGMALFRGDYSIEPERVAPHLIVGELDSSNLRGVRRVVQWIDRLLFPLVGKYWAFARARRYILIKILGSRRF